MQRELPPVTAPREERKFGIMDLRTIYDEIDVAKTGSQLGRFLRATGLAIGVAGEVARRKMQPGLKRKLVVGGAWVGAGVLGVVGESIRSGSDGDRDALVDEAFIRMQEAIVGRWHELRPILDTFSSDQGAEKTASTKLRITSMGSGGEQQGQ